LIPFRHNEKLSIISSKGCLCIKDVRRRMSSARDLLYEKGVQVIVGSLLLVKNEKEE
jgi:hypothetical protein